MYYVLNLLFDGLVFLFFFALLQSAVLCCAVCACVVHLHYGFFFLLLFCLFEIIRTLKNKSFVHEEEYEKGVHLNVCTCVSSTYENIYNDNYIAESWPRFISL